MPLTVWVPSTSVSFVLKEICAISYVFICYIQASCLLGRDPGVPFFIVGRKQPGVINWWLRSLFLFSITNRSTQLQSPNTQNLKPHKVGGFVAATLGHISLDRIAVIEKSLIPALILSFPLGCLYTVYLFSIQPHESLFCHHHSFCEAPQRFLGQVKSLFSLQ